MFWIFPKTRPLDLGLAQSQSKYWLSTTCFQLYQVLNGKRWLFVVTCKCLQRKCKYLSLSNISQVLTVRRKHKIRFMHQSSKLYFIIGAWINMHNFQNICVPTQNAKYVLTCKIKNLRIKTKLCFSCILGITSFILNGNMPKKSWMAKQSRDRKKFLRNSVFQRYTQFLL